MNFKKLESDEKIIKILKENLFKFQPKLIDLPRKTSNLSLNQLWDLVRRENQDFVANYEARHKDVKNWILKEGSLLKKKQSKHQLTVKDILAIIKSILIEKHIVKKISSDFNISTCLVYSALKSDRKNGANKIFERQKENIGKQLKS